MLFDPRQHTHDSCVKELGSSDLLILIIGSRFGGTALPTASSFIDFETIVSHSTRDFIKDFKDELSITQIEVLKAIQ